MEGVKGWRKRKGLTRRNVQRRRYGIMEWEMLKNMRSMGERGCRRRREKMTERGRRKVKGVSEGKDVVKGKEG